jgi:hypothetical protein
LDLYSWSVLLDIVGKICWFVIDDILLVILGIFGILDILFTFIEAIEWIFICFYG